MTPNRFMFANGGVATEGHPYKCAGRLFVGWLAHDSGAELLLKNARAR